MGVMMPPDEVLLDREEIAAPSPPPNSPPSRGRVPSHRDMTIAPRTAALLRWLNEEGRFAPDTKTLLRTLCDKLVASGVPLARSSFHVRTLHPEFRGISRIWRRGEMTEIRTPRHGIEYATDYVGSPVQHISETGEWLDIRLDEGSDRRFPILATLRGQGITHYVMAPLEFSNRIVNAMSWASDAPGGFAANDLALFRDLVPVFVPIFEAKALRRISTELLKTYVGRDPGERIAAGDVQRGDVHQLKAAMLLADLRGFSILTDNFPEARVVELLNAFFDLVVPGIVAGGGEVLKYVGDAVIAIFPVTEDGSPEESCRAAFAAAQHAFAALAAAPPEIRQHIAFDIALHCGDAAYGNIGSGNRLDFTAIGRDVNILSRLELLCKVVGRPLLMTDVFAAELAEPVFEIGHFELRGFRRHQPVFGLGDGSEAVAAG
jgi:adenylate cyclase